MNMNDTLKGKYRYVRSTMGFPARPRTDNTGHPRRDQLPALHPCKRASAGAKVFAPTPQPNTGVRRVLIINAFAGKRTWGWERITDGKPVANFKGDPILKEMGLS